MVVFVECVKCRARSEFGGASVIDCFGAALAAPEFGWSDAQAKGAVNTIRSLPKSEDELGTRTFHLLAHHVECDGVAK